MKKVEVEINGKILKVSEHMVDDLMLFGATLTKRKIREAPQELRFPAPRKIKPVENAEEVIPNEEFNPNEIPEPREVKKPALKKPVKRTKR